MRLIDADKIMWRMGIDTSDKQIFFVTSKDIDEQPTIEATPVVHGQWNKCDQGGFSIKGFMACSVCDVMIPDTNNNHYCMARLHYCPNCGAKMDGGVSDG